MSRRSPSTERRVAKKRAYARSLVVVGVFGLLTDSQELNVAGATCLSTLNAWPTGAWGSLTSPPGCARSPLTLFARGVARAVSEVTASPPHVVAKRIKWREEPLSGDSTFGRPG